MNGSAKGCRAFSCALGPGVLIAAVLATNATFAQEPSSDQRVHVRAGEIAGSEPIVLTPQGARVAFTASATLSAPGFVPDPYDGKCRFIVSKYTLKTADQKELLGKEHEIPDPDSEDALALHPFELRNAAGRLGANAVYLLLSDSEELGGQRGLHECTVVAKDGVRARGESLQEIGCRDDQGVTIRFSRYAGQARFYACRPEPGPAGERRKQD